MLRMLLATGVTALTLCSTLAPAGAAPMAAARPAAESKRSQDGWPDTRAGARASGWVEAFSTGEDAMRAFLKMNMAEAALADRGIPKRIESYRKMRERLGALVLGSVDKSEPYKLTVALLAEDASVHRFVFTVQEKAPHKLISVGMLEHRMGHGGGGGHGH
jgi:hypothetical protein